MALNRYAFGNSVVSSLEYSVIIWHSFHGFLLYASLVAGWSGAVACLEKKPAIDVLATQVLKSVGSAWLSLGSHTMKALIYGSLWTSFCFLGFDNLHGHWGVGFCQQIAFSTLYFSRILVTNINEWERDDNRMPLLLEPSRESRMRNSSCLPASHKPKNLSLDS